MAIPDPLALQDYSDAVEFLVLRAFRATQDQRVWSAQLVAVVSKGRQECLERPGHRAEPAKWVFPVTLDFPDWKALPDLLALPDQLVLLEGSVFRGLQEGLEIQEPLECLDQLEPRAVLVVLEISEPVEHLEKLVALVLPDHQGLKAMQDSRESSVLLE